MNSPQPSGIAAAGLTALLLACAAAPAAAQTASPLPATSAVSEPPAPAAAPPIVAETRPLWEFGLGAAALRLPDYRGADTYGRYLLPLPYIIYRGKYLRAGRDGARAVLLDTERVEFDISLNAGPPARADLGGVRAGMADLPATVEIGPKLRTTLWSGRGGARLNLDLPLRAVVTLERSPRSIGTVFSPNLDLALPTGTPWRLGIQGGPMWGSSGLHAHYYGVSAADAVSSPTLQRPAYEARGGYAGWHALAGLSRHFEHHWVGTYVRHDHVGGAVFADSPLVRSRQNWSAGIAMAWIFAASSEQVPRDR